MKRGAQIVSLLTLALVLAAQVAQALTITQGITYDPQGQPVNPSTLTLIVTILGVAGLLSLPLILASFILGVIASTLERRYGWLAAIIVAGALSLVGFFAMIWILLSANVPVAFQTPLALAPLVTLLYTLLPARRNAVAVAAS